MNLPHRLVRLQLEFDRSLKARALHQGIREFAEVNALAETAGFKLIEDAAMPANNRCLVWQQRSCA